MIAQDDLRPILAANVTRLRRAKELTQVELAEKVGVSEVMINRIEKGKSTPGAELLFSLADILGVPADNLRQLPVDNG